MNRIDRLTAILLQLLSKRILRGKEIADRFGISLRTVYRDIRALEDAGIPIGSEPGMGYFLAPGYHLPPVMFTNKEAVALGAKIVKPPQDIPHVGRFSCWGIPKALLFPSLAIVDLFGSLFTAVVR